MKKITLIIKLINTRIITLFTLLLLTSLNAHAWGERGHHTTGYTAARLIKTLTTPEEKKLLGHFFEARIIQMGHLNNIPDISWKSDRHKEFNTLNGPNHFFDADYVVTPQQDLQQTQEQIRQLETDPLKFIKTYDNKPNPFPDPSTPIINAYHNIGTAPFRVTQLQQLASSALKCAATKTEKSDKRFQDPLTQNTYSCRPQQTWREDIYAAVALMGVMGHFVADLTQPMHTSVDYDGYAYGQGGLHAYFETFALHMLDEKLNHDVLSLAQDPSFQKNFYLKYPIKDGPIQNPTRLMLDLVAESQGHLKKLYELDRKLALIKEGDKIPFGFRKSPTLRDAERRPFDNPTVLNGFRSLIVERLASASLLLGHLWLQTWRDSGRPNLSSANTIIIPYPLDVPFILPNKEWLKVARRK